jgi:hypothetical protein
MIECTEAEQIERLNARVVELLTERDELRKALEPFAQTGWLTGDTEHTARTVVAHMHPEREREIILSSEDFRRAKAALTEMDSKPKRLSGGVRQGIIDQPREHSRKPDCVHGRICGVPGCTRYPPEPSA